MVPPDEREGRRKTLTALFFFPPHFFMAEKIQQVLCKEGALPVLALLLESPDSEVQVQLKQVRFLNSNSVTIRIAQTTARRNEKVERREGFIREVGKPVRTSL